MSDALAANDRFYAAFAKRDVEAMDALWAQTVPVACIHPGWAALVGRDQVMASWRAILRNPRAPQIESSAATVHIMGDTAFVVCEEHVGGTRLVATNIFFLEADGWRIVHHHAAPLVTSVDEEMPTVPRGGGIN